MCNLNLSEMKINWKKVLYTLAVGVGITMFTTACSNEDDKPGTNGPGEPKEQGYLSLCPILGSGAPSRTLVEDAGLTNERIVNSVRIVLYDASSMIAEYAFNYSGENLHENADKQDFQGKAMLDPAELPGYVPGLDGDVIKFMPEAMTVEHKAYRMVVLVNPNSSLITSTRAAQEYECPSTTPTLNTTNLSSYNDFRNSVGSVVADNNLTNFIGTAYFTSNPRNFLMTNAQEYVEVKTTDIKTTETAAYEFPVSVKLDRAVAKVSMRGSMTTINTNSPGIVSDGSWMLDVTNKTSYWMRHKAFILGGTATETSSTPRNYYYAEDPNFDLFSRAKYTSKGQTVPTSVASEEKLAATFNYITKADFVDTNERTKTLGYHATWTEAGNTHEYALENTMTAEEQYEDVTTAAILKIKFLPNVTSLGAELKKAGYFVWQSKWVLTADELKTVRDLTPENPDYSKYATFLELQDYLKKNAATLEDQTNGFGPDYTVLPTTSKQVGELEYNADGMNYYRILIRHFDDTQEPNKMAYGRYGIVRNNWYRLTINSISGVGSIDVPKPKDPDDKDQKVGFEIEIMPWVVRDQPVDVK